MLTVLTETCNKNVIAASMTYPCHCEIHSVFPSNDGGADVGEVCRHWAPCSSSQDSQTLGYLTRGGVLHTGDAINTSINFCVLYQSHAKLFCAVLRRAMLCRALPCYAMLCPAMPCSDMLCHAMLCYAMLCCAMLCYANLCSHRLRWHMLRSPMPCPTYVSLDQCPQLLALRTEVCH